MTDPLRLGVVGAGSVSQCLLRHLMLPDVADAVAVVNVCDPAPGRAEATAAAFGIARFSRDLDELLDDDRVDAVTIASPIGLHYEQGMTAICTGRHVHFNKTMAVTSEEATQLIEEARLRRVALVASPGEMLRPHHARVKELLAEGAIGTVCWAACGASLGTYHERESERAGGAGGAIDPSRCSRRPGGGSLYDMTVDSLHALTGILGNVRRVTALSGVRIAERQSARRAGTDADDNTVMLLDFGDGLFAFAHGTAAGILTDDPRSDINGRYYGTSGEIVGKKLNGKPFDYAGSVLAAQDPHGDQWLLPHVRAEHRTLPEQHVFEDVMQLVDLVRDGTITPVTPEHARHVIEIIEAAYRAAVSGETQDLRTTVTGMRGGESVRRLRGRPGALGHEG